MRDLTRSWLVPTTVALSFVLVAIRVLVHGVERSWFSGKRESDSCWLFITSRSSRHPAMDGYSCDSAVKLARAQLQFVQLSAKVQRDELPLRKPSRDRACYAGANTLIRSLFAGP